MRERVGMGHRRAPHPTTLLSALAVVLVALASVGAWLVVDAAPAAACSCAGVTDQEARDQADVVFVGRVREVRLPDSDYSAASSTVWFDVDAVVKGEAHAEQAVTTAQSSASCGLELNRLAGPILVFATRVDDGALEASGCGGTRPTAEGALPVSWVAGPPLPGRDEAADDTEILPALIAVVVVVAAVSGTTVLVTGVVRRHRAEAHRGSTRSPRGPDAGDVGVNRAPVGPDLRGRRPPRRRWQRPRPQGRPRG